MASPKAKAQLQECAPPPPSRAEPPTLAELLDERIPSGEGELEVEEREELWRSLTAGGNGDSVGLPAALAGLPHLLQKKRTDSQRKEDVCVLESLIPGITDFKPAVKLAFQFVPLWDEAAIEFDDAGMAAAPLAIRKKDFEKLLVNFRQIVELAACFKEADILKNRLLDFSRCAAALPTLESWGVSEEELQSRIPTDDRGVNFGVFAKWAMQQWLETLRLPSPSGASSVRFAAEAGGPDDVEDLQASWRARLGQGRSSSVPGSPSGAYASRGLDETPTPAEAMHRPNDEALNLWIVTDSVGCGIRTEPTFHDHTRTGEDLTHGEVFDVVEEKRCAGNIIFLRLADGRGWAFNKKLGIGVTCQRQAAVPAAISTPSPKAATRELGLAEPARAAPGELGPLRSPTGARSIARSLGSSFSPGTPKPLSAGVHASTGSLGGTGKIGTLTSQSRHRSMPKLSFGVKVTGQPPDINPGPGSYNTHEMDGTKQSKFRNNGAFGFGGGNRFGTGSNPAKDKPGPGAYGVPDDPGKYKNDLRVGFPMGARNIGGKIRVTAPGPGAYPYKTFLAVDAPAFSSHRKVYRKYHKSLLRPGPGSYDPKEVQESKFPHVGAPCFGSSTREDLGLKHVQAGPGPGTYDMERCNTLASNDAAKFSLVSRKKSRKMESYFMPGPGMYDNHHTSFGY